MPQFDAYSFLYQSIIILLLFGLLYIFFLQHGLVTLGRNLKFRSKLNSLIMNLTGIKLNGFQKIKKFFN
jgi:hypothetical protein